MKLAKHGLLLFLAVVLGLVALSNGITLLSNVIFLTSSESAEGTVVISADGRKSVSYPDKFGQQHWSAFQRDFSWTYSAGEKLPVLYSTAKPDDFRVGSFSLLFAVPFGVCAFSFLAALIAFKFVDRRFLINEIRVALGHPPLPEPVTAIATSVAMTDIAIQNAPSQSSHPGRRSFYNAGELFGPLSQFVDDPEISDIVMAAPDAIFVKKGAQTVKSNLVFPNMGAYLQCIERMLSVAENLYSVAKPIVDGMVTPLVRIHAVHQALCETGPYVTLRISRFTSVRFSDLAKSPIAPREVLAYLRSMLLTGHTLLFAGEVGTGKTTLIRALASTIPLKESILVIEDTPEIKIEHPAVRYVRTREANNEGIGKVTPSECIKAGMRMAMNRIIFGEIRDPDAAESFIDVCVSGHPGMSTIHAKSALDAISRLELFLSRRQAGVERSAIREQIAAAVQVIVYTQVCRETGQRRLSEVVEIARGTDEPIKHQTIFTYQVAGNVPVWKVHTKHSFYDRALKDFEGGSPLIHAQDWLQLDKK